MFKQFILDLKLHKKDYLLPLCMIPGCFLLGFGGCCIIMFAVGDVGGWITCGAYAAFVSLLVYTVMNFAKYHQEFMLSLSMGRTRGAFMLSYALRTLLEMFAAYGLVLVLSRLEVAVGNKLFAPAPLEAGADFLLDWRMIAFFSPAMVIFAMFIGALYTRFGKKVLAVMWFVYMAICLIGPRLAEASGTLGKVVKFLSNVPTWGWITAGVAGLAAMVATTIGLGKKQMVK